MIAIQFPNVKSCMAKLLLSPTFDPFYFIEGEIVTYSTFSIDGRFHSDFFSEEDLQEYKEIPEYSYWKDIREFCFSLIKGRRTPLSFKLIFGLDSAQIAKLLSFADTAFTSNDVQGAFLNFHYDGTSLQCITGTSLNLFTLDKSLEQAFDLAIQKFLAQQEIPFELLS